MGQAESMIFLPSGVPVILLEHQLCEGKGEHQRGSSACKTPKNDLQRCTLWGPGRKCPFFNRSTFPHITAQRLFSPLTVMYTLTTPEGSRKGLSLNLP